MVQIGKMNRRRIVRESSIGVFLQGDAEWEDFLLPRKYVPNGASVGDTLDVFVYFDSEGRIISTTLKPLAQVGEFATLKVTSIEEFGIFLDWGIGKDLFLPHREQLFKMDVGRKYPVHVYLDNTGRPAASTRINKFVDKSRPSYTSGDAVELLIYQQTDLGLRAVVDGRYTGVIFNQDTLNNLRLGQTVTGYIKNIRDDHKIDLSLQPLGSTSNRFDLSELLLSKLKENHGFLEINAKTTADVINEMFGVSRKKFKIALGSLYKKKLIKMKDNGIQLTVNS